MYKLFFANATTYLDEKAFKDGYKKVSSYRKAKIDALKQPEDKARSLAAGILLEQVLDEYGLTELIDCIKDGEHGKPYFDCEDTAFPGPRMYFSLSHSGDYAMVGIADCEIGVDIQKMKELKEDIASRCFCEAEQDLYYKASDAEYLETFYRIWCLKESYAKYTGIGVAVGFNTFSVLDHIQDSGVWHDEYVYAVTTTDYKEEQKILDIPIPEVAEPNKPAPEIVIPEFSQEEIDKINEKTIADTILSEDILVSDDAIMGEDEDVVFEASFLKKYVNVELIITSVPDIKKSGRNTSDEEDDKSILIRRKQQFRRKTRLRRM